MTTYKEIRGTNIEAVASDPSNPVEGQVWYNTTTNVVKGLVDKNTAVTETWATSGIIQNTVAREKYGRCWNSSTAALAFGGSPPSAKTRDGPQVKTICNRII